MKHSQGERWGDPDPELVRAARADVDKATAAHRAALAELQKAEKTRNGAAIQAGELRVQRALADLTRVRRALLRAF